MDSPSEPLSGSLSDPSLWTVLERKGSSGQRSGPIRGRLRNSALPTLSGHDNRAGHRLYVKVNQGRAFRKGVYGFGRWRRYDEHGDHHEHARNTAVTPLAQPRWVRRAFQVTQDKRNRRAGLRVGWRKP